MPLHLVDRVWVLSERLYIHSHSTSDFVALLDAQGISYNSEAYSRLSSTKAKYTFMSEPDFGFAQFMKGIATHKYLPLLECVVFDPKCQLTATDDWNYYGELIRNWYPELIELLTLAGVLNDETIRRLSYVDPGVDDADAAYIAVVFGDAFLDHIREEANSAYDAKHFLSVSFLTRKIIEVSLIRLCEVVFPKITSGAYSESNHDIWYDKVKGQYRGLAQLLDNVSDNAAAFHEDADLVKTFVGLVKPLRRATNAVVHFDYVRPDSSYLRDYRVPYVLELAHRLFRKYCNP